MDKDNTLITILALVFIILVALSATKLFPNSVLEVVNTGVRSPVTVQATTTATTSLGAIIVPVKVSAATTTPTHTGKTYRLTQFNGTLIPEAQVYTMRFEGGAIPNLGAKFCNSMGGSYTLDRGMLHANLVSTEMACGNPENIMLIESTFANMLAGGARLSVSGETLTLVDSLENRLVFSVYLD